MSFIFRHLPLALGVLTLGGCVPGFACDSLGAYAVNVEVQDSATGASIVRGATLVVRDGAYADSMRMESDMPPVLAAAAERPGIYEVLVRRPGYQTWTREGVRVRRGGRCNALQPVRLVAKLSPATPSE